MVNQYFMSLLGLSCNLIILWKLYNYEYDDENENDDGNDDENDIRMKMMMRYILDKMSLLDKSTSFR